MPQVFKLHGFTQYVIIDKIMYKKAKRVKDERYTYKYLDRLKIKKTLKDNQIGYYLVKNGKRKFYSLKKLRHKLIKHFNEHAF